MFGKKTNEEKPAIPISARIETIPQAFYGGNDPVVYQNSVSKSSHVDAEKPQIVAATPKPLPPPRPASGRVLAPATTSLQKPLPQSGSKKLLIVGIVGLLIISIGGYFAYTYFFSVEPIPEVSPVVTPPIITTPSPVEVPVIVATTTPEPIVVTSTPVPVIRGGGSLKLPELSYIQILDDDKDTVSDREEAEVFQIDPGVWDTDKDGYYDGLEIGNLYNPKGIAPQRIIDSGIVKEYVSPIWQYRLYYPSMWKMDSIDARGDDMLLSGSSGDYIEIRAFKKEKGMDFSTWFSQNLQGENFGNFSSFENRFKMIGYKRQDGRVAFYETENAVYSIVYFFGAEERNSYPKVMEVLVQSFRPSKVILNIPDQTVLPGVLVPNINSSSSMILPQDSPSSSNILPVQTNSSTNFVSSSDFISTSTPNSILITPSI